MVSRRPSLTILSPHPFCFAQRIYSDSFLLFHDPLGGSVIAGIWNPALQEPRNFKVQLGFSSRPFALEGDEKVSPELCSWISLESV